MTHPMLTLTDEVATALAEGRPVVALESTIISHGMPYPRNVEMAVEVEGIVRDGGAVPATIAVLDGRPRIGLTRDDLELLASDPDVVKVSVRDLPYVVARGLHGATTVASTMRLAALAERPGVRDRRARRRAPRGAADLRHLRRPHRARRHRRWPWSARA